MNRWLWFCICTVLAAAMLLLGWLTPIHLRALDSSVVQQAGRKTPGLVERGLELASHNKLGAAQMLSQAADRVEIPERQRLARAVGDLLTRDPAAIVWGGDASAGLENLFRSGSGKPKSGGEPLTEFVIRLENRDQVLDLLRASPLPALRELLQCRSLTNTVVFPPSTSAAGQAFDAAISICGLLIEEGDLSPSFRDWVAGQAAQANRGGDSRPLEDALLDLISLGQRLNWGQVAVIAGHIDDPNALHIVTGMIRAAGEQLPVLYSSMELSGKPAAVAAYTVNFSQTGLNDLAATLPDGSGGVDELLRRGQQLYTSKWRQRAAQFAPLRMFCRVAADYALRTPAATLAVKWLFYLSSGFWAAMAMHFARPARWDSEDPSPLRGVRAGREILFAMGSLVVVLLLSEPFLAQESQKLDLPIRLHLPMLGSAAAAGTPHISASVMNPQSLLTLLLFFVLQALIYTACIVKLGEIRRQRTPARVKLKLLENEEHLFDAGLYLGFAGTIVSLILVSLGMIKNPSLMAAYSSTAFGIIFVSIFKIFNLRPARRLLVLEAETLSDETRAAASEARILTHS